MVGEHFATKYYPNHLSRLKRVENHSPCFLKPPKLNGKVPFAAVFSLVTQRSTPTAEEALFWGGALRDGPKNGCEGVYKLNGANHLIFQAEFPVFPCKW